MSPEFRKEAYRLFWLVKGHLGCHTWSDEAIIKMHDSYFKRLWCMYQGEDTSVLLEGFEEAYQKRLDKKSK